MQGSKRSKNSHLRVCHAAPASRRRQIGAERGRPAAAVIGGRHSRSLRVTSPAPRFAVRCNRVRGGRRAPETVESEGWAEGPGVAAAAPTLD